MQQQIYRFANSSIDLYEVSANKKQSKGSMSHNLLNHGTQSTRQQPWSRHQTRATVTFPEQAPEAYRCESVREENSGAADAAI